MKPTGEVASTVNLPALFTRHARQRITWNGVSDLSQLSDRQVRLEFHLTRGRLYAFWVTPDANGASYGYVAAGGPGFAGPIDVP